MKKRTERRAPTPRAAIYVRVSSRDQTRGVSPEVQRKQCHALVTSKGFALTKVYYDAGISGKAMEKRSELRALLEEAGKGEFQHVVIWSISRFGRNLRDLAENMLFLKERGVTIHSLKEGIDSSNAYGKMVFQVLGAVAELESEMIAERTGAARAYLESVGVPSVGRVPFGRKWVWEGARSAGHWELDGERARVMREIVGQYVDGKRLKDLAKTYGKRYPEIAGLKYKSLVAIFNRMLGDTWVTKHATHKIPALVDRATLARVKRTLKRNTVSGRATKATWLFEPQVLRCDRCKWSLVRQAQNNGRWRYYHHKRENDCAARWTSIPAKLVEDLVLKNAFENVYDEEAFAAAVAKSIPSSKDVAELDGLIATDEALLKKLQGELNKLVDIALKGTLSRATIQKREGELYGEIGRVTTELERNRRDRADIPDPSKAKREAKRLRTALMDYFGNLPDPDGKTWLETMSDADKRRFLKSLFPRDARGEDGEPYGVFVDKKKDGSWSIYVKAVLYAGWLDDILAKPFSQD
jgi:DNA invertase Pin-like site-specific DNA recombinase